MDGKHPTMRNMTNSESIDRQLLPSSSSLFASHPEHSTLSTSPVPVAEGTRNTSNFQAPDAYSTSLQRLPPETFPRFNSDDGGGNYYDADGDDLDEEGLLTRIRKNRMRLERLRNKQQKRSGQLNGPQQKQTQEAATRRMNSSVAQDEILESMLKTMQTCNARGFVFGMISEKGEPISGTSDNLRDWWKEQVRFDCNGPAAAEKYDIEHSASAGSDDQKTD